MRNFFIDRVQFLAIAAKVSQVSSGLVLILIVSRYFDLTDQGYIYTFTSIAAVQVLFEMGLVTALTQLAAHEMAQLRWTEGVPQGPATPMARVRYLVRFTSLWFSAAGICLFVGLAWAGLAYFTLTSNGQISGHVTRSWIALVSAVGVGLLVSAFLGLLEGLGRVSRISLVRLMQFGVGAVIGLVAAANGAGLMTLAFQAWSSVIVGALCLWLFFRRGFRALWGVSINGPMPSWRRDILPFQARIAISWISGYLIYQLMIPWVFATAGPEAAGKLGMSLQILTAISSIAIVVVTSKIPDLVRLLVMEQLSELASRFRNLGGLSLALAGGGAACVIVSVAIASSKGLSIAGRLLSVLDLSILAVGVFASHIVYIQAVGLRMRKAEPLAVVSAVNALATVGLLWLLVPKWGGTGAVLAFCFTQVFFSLPAASLIYRRHVSRLPF